MIGIISAMVEEIDLLLNEMTDTTEHQSGNRTYYHGCLQDKKVVIAFSRWGKVASATTATDMIKTFPLIELVFVGVAGAISTELNIGDIVIGDKLIQHDMNASPIFPEFEIPLIERSAFSTDKARSKKLTQAAIDYIESFDIPLATLEKFNITLPQIKAGTIASGDQFISSEKKRQELISKIPDLLCVEMEGAAVAQVCDDYNIPYAIIRIISDKADHSAAIDFQAFVNEIASTFSLKILNNYLSYE